MSNSKHTPGRWSAQGPKINADWNQTYFSINSDCGIVRGESYLIPGFFYPTSGQTPEEMQANADFIAEAGTVANECGLTPRELLEQRNEILEALKAITNHYTDFLTHTRSNEVIKRATTVINKATQ